MRFPSAGEVLRAWEVGEGQHPIERALTLLSLSHADRSWDELAALTVGERDAALLALRERLFGPTLQAFARCEACGGELEFALSAGELRLAPHAPPAGRVFELAGEGGLTIRFRLPDSRDLATVVVEGARGGHAAGRSALLRRCVLDAARDGEPVSWEEIPDEAQARLAERMSEADPQAEILFDLTCPECGHAWEVLFDVGSFLWTEVRTLAMRLLREVHFLARGYGWREADILAMSDRRRKLYLQMLGE